MVIDNALVVTIMNLSTQFLSVDLTVCLQQSIVWKHVFLGAVFLDCTHRSYRCA